MGEQVPAILPISSILSILSIALPTPRAPRSLPPHAQPHRKLARDLAALPGDLGGGPGQMILNPIQHRANDLHQVKAQTLGKIALNGAIDTAVLAMGTVADVRHEVDTVMEALKPGGGYVCAPDQGIPGIPVENTRALWERAQEVGRY